MSIAARRHGHWHFVAAAACQCMYCSLAEMTLPSHAPRPNKLRRGRVVEVLMAGATLAGCMHRTGHGHGRRTGARTGRSRVPAWLLGVAVIIPEHSPLSGEAVVTHGQLGCLMANLDPTYLGSW